MQPYSFFGRRSVVSRFERLRADDRLGQAFLFVGPEGSGKETTALEIARRFNCVDPDRCRPEQPCESCRKAATFQHPDIRWIGPAPATIDETGARDLFQAKQENPFYQPPYAVSSQVSIGDPEHPGPLTIRSLIHFLRRRAFQGTYKVAVVSDSHRLTKGAANAFLKTLEEPPPATLLFLLTANSGGLLPTINSRCQKIQFEPYPETRLVEIVEQLGGVDPEQARDAARLADGNARRAMAGVRPENQILLRAAENIFGWLHAQRQDKVYLAADRVHGGIIPTADEQDAAAAKRLAVKEAVAKRERAILLCEMLNLYYSEVLSCRLQDADWQPRLSGSITHIRRFAGQRKAASLLRDIANIEATKREIDRNLNIGLSLTVLFQGLIDNVESDRSTG